MGRLSTNIILWLLLLTAIELNADTDHDEAYRLRENKEILALEVLLERIDLPPNSRLLEIELEHEDGRLLYEIEYVIPSGVIEELLVDPHTAEIIGREREDD